MKFLRSVTFASLIVLTACSGNDVKEKLGLDRGTPDEFRVVSRPPLSVPPEFDLRPPSDTSSGLSANQLPTTEKAEDILIGNRPATAITDSKQSAAPVTTQNAAEMAFLKEAGADHADPNVRKEITEEQLAMQEQRQDDSSWWDILPSANAPKKEPVVNATREAQRIKTDEDTGQPVTVGDTPTVKQKDTGLLGQVFGY